jgi:hypothetical protein
LHNKEDSCKAKAKERKGRKHSMNQPTEERIKKIEEKQEDFDK